MSQSLATDLTSGSIDASLNEIDSRSRDSEQTGSGRGGDFSVGPFSVLNFTPNVVNSTTATTIQRGSPEETGAAASSSAEPSFDGALVTNAPSPGFGFDSLFSTDDDVLHWDDLFDLQTNPLDALLHDPLAPVELETPASEFPLWPEVGITPDPSHHEAGLRSATNGNVRDNEPDRQQLLTPRQHSPTDALTSADVLADAPFLLKHFENDFITVMMPQSEKSPWMIMVIPSAKLTLSELTFFDRGGRKLSHAQLANFYCILACSAYLLSVNPSEFAHHSTEHWKLIASQTYATAKSHIQHSLRTEVSGPKKAKYKDQLMAIEGMLTFAVRIVPL